MYTWSVVSALLALFLSLLPEFQQLAVPQRLMKVIKVSPLTLLQ